MALKRWLLLAAVALPPLVLSAIGLSHPKLLTVESAGWWTTMHVILVPLFPLLAVAIWILLRADRSALGWGGRVAALAYVAFYGALDAISGIAAGTVVLDTGSTDDTGSLFAIGHRLGVIGGYAFLVALILVLGSAWRAGSRGVPFYVAAVVLLVSGYLFLSSHIYWPKGGLTMIGFAVGFFLLEFTRRRATPPAA